MEKDFTRGKYTGSMWGLHRNENYHEQESHDLEVKESIVSWDTDISGIEWSASSPW